MKFNEFYYRYREINDQWWQQYRIGKAKKSELRTGRFRDTLQRFGITNEELVEWLASEYVNRSPYQTALFPGAIETLEAIRDMGIKLNIITNGFEEVQHIKVTESGMGSYFEHIITSEQVSARKPDIRIFEHALEVCGAEASTSLMIGDNLDADIRGAADIKMDQVYFNPHGEKHESNPTYEVKALGEILSIIR